VPPLKHINRREYNRKHFRKHPTPISQLRRGLERWGGGLRKGGVRKVGRGRRRKRRTRKKRKRRINEGGWFERWGDGSEGGRGE